MTIAGHSRTPPNNKPASATPAAGHTGDPAPLTVAQCSPSRAAAKYAVARRKPCKADCFKLVSYAPPRRRRDDWARSRQRCFRFFKGDLGRSLKSLADAPSAE
jgi:hypothetical protein